MEIINEKFNQVITKALELEGVSLDYDLVRSEQLDSIVVMSLIALIDMHFGIMIKGSEILNCATVNDIYCLLEKKLSCGKEI